jgi:hypothetical protein
MNAAEKKIIAALETAGFKSVVKEWDEKSASVRGVLRVWLDDGSVNIVKFTNENRYVIASKISIDTSIGIEQILQIIEIVSK